MVSAKSRNHQDPRIVTLLQAIRWQDTGLAGHTHRVCRLATAIGRELILDHASLTLLRSAALLHDLGKFLVPQEILEKPGHLNRREWEIMREHPLTSEELCKTIPSLRDVLPIIRAHHERWDGSGYPDGLKGTEIPLLTQITQIADIADALMSLRSYKNPLSLEDTINTIKSEAERGWRDPTLVARAIPLIYATFRRMTQPGVTPLCTNLP